MRPVFVALICLGLIISNGKSAPTKKQNVKWHECIDECTYNFDKDMSIDAISAFVVPQVGAWLNHRNMSFASMIMEGTLAVDTFKHKNDFELCLSNCDIYYSSTHDKLFEEGLELIQESLANNYKELLEIEETETEFKENMKNHEAQQDT